MSPSVWYLPIHAGSKAICLETFCNDKFVFIPVRYLQAKPPDVTPESEPTNCNSLVALRRWIALVLLQFDFLFFTYQQQGELKFVLTLLMVSKN